MPAREREMMARTLTSIMIMSMCQPYPTLTDAWAWRGCRGVCLRLVLARSVRERVRCVDAECGDGGGLTGRCGLC